MLSDSTALVAPDPDSLPILYEAARLLGRGLDPADSLGPLLSLLASASGLSRGLAAARRGEAEDLLLVAGTEAGDSGLLGRPLDYGSHRGRPGASSGAGRVEAAATEATSALLHLMSRVYERGVRLEEGRLLALPALAGGRIVCVLGFCLEALPGGLKAASGGGKAAQSPRAAQDLAEASGALYAEAYLLRRQVAEEAGRLASLHGESSHAFYPGHGGKGLQARARQAQPVHPGDPALAKLLGVSQAMAEVRAVISRVAPTDSTVLLLGESGTGKEVAARAIHGASQRSEGPFVAVNCAALPPALIESELFGHERGSFTGAQARRLGRFELAAGGSLFLDEVAEIPLGLQAKLLRALQERTFERVGGSKPIRADLRIIAATNRDLEKEVAEGRFRADLYWRLAVFPIRLPPLRERGGDIVLLADHFTESFAASTGRPVSRISTPALDLLTSYHWPGNVRELENAIERAVILSSDGVIHAYHLPPSLQSAESTGTGPASTLDAALARLERELLVEALKIEGGNAAAAARSLGVSERRMGLALKRYGIDWRRFRRLGR